MLTDEQKGAIINFFGAVKTYWNAPAGHDTGQFRDLLTQLNAVDAAFSPPEPPAEDPPEPEADPAPVADPPAADPPAADPPPTSGDPALASA